MGTEKLRKATFKDADLLFRWVNDPVVRNNALNQQKIRWEDHLVWFKNLLDSIFREIYILEIKEVAVGQIRIEYHKGWWKIDYSVVDEYRGLGYGTLLVDQIIKKFPNRRFIAEVKELNIPSTKVFDRLNFELSTKNSIMIFRYRSPSICENIVLLSSRSWNKTIYSNLKRKFETYNWIWMDEKQEFTLETIIALDPKYIFIPHWSHIIPKNIHNNFRCVLFHMTDLPYGRGGSPLQNLILNKKLETKISAIDVVEKLDAGPIYLKSPLSLKGNAKEIFLRSNKIIEKMIEEIVLHQPLPSPQKGNPTVFRRRKPDQSNIENVDSLENCYDYIRMLDCEGYPKAYLETKHLRIEFDSANFNKNELIANVRILKK